MTGAAPPPPELAALVPGMHCRYLLGDDLQLPGERKQAFFDDFACKACLQQTRGVLQIKIGSHALLLCFFFNLFLRSKMCLLVSLHVKAF